MPDPSRTPPQASPERVERHGEPSDERLARLHRWCQTGRVAAAELELTDWCRGESPAPGAPALLARIKAWRGDLSGARDVLRRHHDHASSALDADGCESLVALHTLLNEPEDAAHHTTRLHLQHGTDPTVCRWLAVSDPPGVESLPPQSTTNAAQLADELKTRPGLISTLVFAQRHRPRTSAIETLRGALLRLAAAFADDRESSLAVCRGLATLAQLAGDEDEARRWAYRGLKLDPYNAELALILSWVPDETAVGEPARDVLARVQERHPGYRDVAAALERRRVSDAQPDQRRAA